MVNHEKILFEFFFYKRGMKKKLFVLVAIGWMFVFYGYAQQDNQEPESRPLQSVAFNILGEASGFSFNYERFFVLNDKMLLSAKIGMGVVHEFEFCIFGNCSPLRTFFTVPHHVTLNLGKRRHFFEIGMGGTLLGGYYILYPVAGWKIIPEHTGGFYFRLFLEHPIQRPEGVRVIFWPLGLSLGMTI